MSLATPSPGTAQAGRTTLSWPLAALTASLSGLRPGLVVEVLAEADSSNTRLLERAREGDIGQKGQAMRDGADDFGVGEIHGAQSFISVWRSRMISIE